MKFSTLLLVTFFAVSACAQKGSRQDILRGSITPQRAWWDLVHYDLSVEVLPKSKTLIGTNVVTYKVLKEGVDELQIDLQAPMEITSVMQDGYALEIRSEGSAHFIQLEKKQIKGELKSISISFEGKPIVAKNPPWDGGITWQKDKNGNDFIANANQGIGSSVWWPNRDHPEDEVDSLDMHITVPKHLVDVSNGKLVSIDSTEHTKTYHWTVKNPINNYGVSINVGDYVSFNEINNYLGENGPLEMTYWVLRDDLSKARKQFKQAPMMMKAFEHWFGPYPFYEDGYKLVQVPYLGMEHQSAVTYGNGFKNGYKGSDWSKTGIGLKFDYILVHESGHEWFANNITNKDVADMWLHESFTTYSESLFVDYHFGKEAASQYVIGERKAIRNDIPIIGDYGKNSRGSGGDMYFKGASILHTLRMIANDDELWRQTLRGINSDFKHQTVTSETIENYIANKLDLDLAPFFDQYLRTTKIPIFEYKIDKKTLSYRYNSCIRGFTMPIEINIDGESKWITPTDIWKTMSVSKKTQKIKIAQDFYVQTRKV